MKQSDEKPFSERVGEVLWMGDVVLREGAVRVAIIKEGQQINLSFEEAEVLRDALAGRIAKGEWG